MAAKRMTKKEREQRHRRRTCQRSRASRHFFDKLTAKAGKILRSPPLSAA